MSTKVSYPYILKESYLQVTIGRKPFALESSHPTFNRLKNALKKKEWAKVPKLVSIAESISNESHGNIMVQKGKVFYKGREVHNSLTERILGLMNKNKPVKHIILFMDNLYQNPSEDAVREFYDWLMHNELPITDDGCFLAYKSVDENYKDQHTHSIDNHPGQVIMMPRKSGDQDYRNQCSYGFHICSKQYGLYGTRVMAVKVNPTDVLSAVSGKMRVVKYEVLMELGKKDNESFMKEGFSQLEKQIVVEIGKERSQIIKMILASPTVKRNIRKKKLSKDTILKASYARLKSMLQKYDLVPKIGPEDNRFLESARKAAGLSIGQIAKKAKMTYKQVAVLEKKDKPEQSQIDRYLRAIADLAGIRDLRQSAITYPKPVKV